MQYIINFTIDAAGVAAIQGVGQYVTLVKNVVSDPLPEGNLPVSWLNIAPEGTIGVSWFEEYYLYATTTELEGGAVIDLTQQTTGPALPGYEYVFEDGVFNQPPTGSGSAYEVNNQQEVNGVPQAGFSFGLAQEAAVTGAQPALSPLNCVPVLYNEEVSFTPIETVSIFLSGYSDNGVVISQVAGNALVVTLTSQLPIANVGFDDNTNSFYLISLTAPAMVAQGA